METQKYTWSTHEVHFLNLCICFQTQKYRGSILEVNFVNLCIYVQTEKYKRSTFSKMMYFFSNSELYLKTFDIDVLVFALRSVFEIDFQNLCIHVRLQVYIWSRFPKWLYFFLNSKVYLKYTSFQHKSKSINELLLKYKQSTSLIFFFFFVFILCLYFFLGSSPETYFYWTSKIWSTNEAYLNILPIQFFSVKVIINTQVKCSNY